MNPDNIVQLLPDVKDMVTNGYTKSHWLQYYKNLWTRNAVAMAIDVQGDKVRKAEDPEMIVEDNNQSMPVKIRLENRKIKLQDYLDVITAIDALMAIEGNELDAKVFSKEALAVDEDMLPKEEPKAEDPEVKKVDEETSSEAKI